MERFLKLATVVQKMDNGLHLTIEGAIDAVDSQTWLIETTGRIKECHDMGPRHGWHEVFVIDPSESKRYGWIPWTGTLRGGSKILSPNGLDTDFLVIWQLPKHGDQGSSF